MVLLAGNQPWAYSGNLVGKLPPSLPMLEVILPLMTACFEDRKSCVKLCTELIILNFHNRGILYHAFFTNLQDFSIKPGLCNSLEGWEGVGRGMEVQEGGVIGIPMTDSC